MIEEAPNVVTEDGLRGLLAEGYLIEVVCKEGAEKRHNSWYGAWVIRAVAPDGSSDKMLVTSRSYLKVREFKTIVGLVSFLETVEFVGERIGKKCRLQSFDRRRVLARGGRHGRKLLPHVSRCAGA